jgi:hypothetical protein
MTRASQATDGELLAAVVAGDGQAFASFYRRHLPAVVAFLLLRPEIGRRPPT